MEVLLVSLSSAFLPLQGLRITLNYKQGMFLMFMMTYWETFWNFMREWLSVVIDSGERHSSKIINSYSASWDKDKTDLLLVMLAFSHV